MAPMTPGNNGGDDDVITEVEDELGLDRATVVDVFERGDDDDDDAQGNCRDRYGDASVEFKDALDYVRAAVGATLPPDAKNYIDVLPRQRLRAQLPRVWLRGIIVVWTCQV